MAKYRPKSLDELNRSYDKTVSTQNSIEATASAISTEAFPVESETSAEKIDKFFAEHSDMSAGGCADLTEDIQNFIRNFGKPATAEDEIAIRRHRPVPIKLRQIPNPPKPLDAPVQPADTAAEPQSAPADAPAPKEVKPEKAEFVITAEKNELFEEYMRIMSDDDDDDYSKSRRKRKKNRKAAEAEAPKQEEPKQTSPEAEEADFTSYNAPDYTVEEEESESFASFTEEEEAPKEEKKALSLTEDKDSPFADNDDEDIDEEKEEKLPRKKSGLQLVLILILFLTLISALAVTAVQTLIKVNSGEMFMDKYYVYSAAVTDRVTDINEGDLVFIENVKTEDNSVFAYSTPDGIAYAVQTFSGEPERTSGKNSTSDHIVVLNTSIKGKVTRIYPSLGAVAAAISENFMTVIAGLLLLAILIILLLIFAFRRTGSGKASQKDNFSFDEDEDFDEASDEDFSLR